MDQKFKILAIDDDKEQIFIYNEKLSTIYDLKTSNSYAEAEKILADFIPDLLLLDIALPDKSGLDIYSEIKQKKSYQKTRVIFISGNREEEIKMHCYKLGTADYIEKPFSARELVAKIKLLEDQVLKEKNFETEVFQKNEELASLTPLTYLGMHTLELIHNLKNILTILNGNIVLMGTHCDKKTGGSGSCDISLGHLQKIKLASSRIEDIVHLILEHTKDRVDLGVKELDLNDIIKKELSFFQELQKGARDIEIEFISNLLPPFLGVYGHFSQIIANFLQNAMDALTEQTEKKDDVNYSMKITITTQLDNSNGSNDILISFKDNGIGIEEKNIAQIFDPFFSTKKKNKSSGSGIGLSYIKNMVENYRGDIQVTSEINVGTTFTLRLPIKH